MKAWIGAGIGVALASGTWAVPAAHAGALPVEPIFTTVTTATSKTSTKAYAGLNWTFGARKGPELVLGVAQAKTRPSGRVTGARASVHLGLGDGISFNAAKVTGFTGTRRAQAELGLGFGGKGSGAGPFGVVGVMVPNANAGADIYFDGRVAPYIGVNTLGRWKPGSVTTTVAVPPPPPPAVIDEEVIVEPTRRERIRAVVERVVRRVVGIIGGLLGGQTPT